MITSISSLTNTSLSADCVQLDLGGAGDPPVAQEGELATGEGDGVARCCTAFGEIEARMGDEPACP